MFGKTQDQLAGTTLWEQWPSSIRTEIERGHRHALKEQAPVDLPNSEGSENLLELHAYSC